MIDVLKYLPKKSELEVLENGKWKTLDSNSVDYEVIEALDKSMKKVQEVKTVEEKQIENLTREKEDLAKSNRIITQQNTQLSEDKEQLTSENEHLSKEKAKLEEKVNQSNAVIAKLLTGDSDSTVSEDIINLYPEWQEGLSIDEGDAYRVGNVLYIAKKEHISSAENNPKKDKKAGFWIGGSNGQIDSEEDDKKNHEEIHEEPSKYKYPKGTEIQYLGQSYYALEDTNQGPEVGYPTWDLVANRQDD